MSVRTGLSSLVKSAPIFSATSRTSPMNVNVPRPYCAALVRKNELGADPMPIVNRRRSDTRCWINWISSPSLPTAPSVRNTTWRTNPGATSEVNAASSAGFISVPPRARSAATKLFAFASVAASTGMGAPNNALVTELNSITLKRSPGDKRSSAICSASFACLIDVPSIEPDVSMMKTASRGLRGVAESASAGGTIIASA